MDLTLALEKLKRYETEIETSNDILGNTFDTCFQLFEIIEGGDLSSNSEEFQALVKKCITYLEKSTVMVNELNLFSSNEAIEEVHTSSIRYMLLPALLGSLNILVQNKDAVKRLESIQIAEVYFKDFLTRCKNYELSEMKLLDGYENELFENGSNNVRNALSASTMSDLAATRQNKIQRFKLKKELQKREKELKPALGRKDAEDYIREYYLVLLERWILIAFEELENIKREKAILSSMVPQEDSSRNNIEKPKPPDIKSLKPVIITKNEHQKKVFGLGYPSLPVMTIDDFYHQRFEKLIKEQRSVVSLQDRAIAGDTSEKDEEIEKEKLLEKDDPTALRKARAWDDWKDENPRGSGNRKNKG